MYAQDYERLSKKMAKKKYVSLALVLCGIASPASVRVWDPDLWDSRRDATASEWEIRESLSKRFFPVFFLCGDCADYFGHFGHRGSGRFSVPSTRLSSDTTSVLPKWIRCVYWWIRLFVVCFLCLLEISKYSLCECRISQRKSASLWINDRGV